MGDYSAQAAQIVNAIAIAVANWSTAVAIASIRWLLSTLGQATEPDLTAIVPVYDRMLAIALLLLGAIVAMALIEHRLGLTGYRPRTDPSSRRSHLRRLRRPRRG
jgi:hypothetical protein